MTTSHETAESRTVEAVIRAATLHLPGATPPVAAALAHFCARPTPASLHALALAVEPGPAALVEAVTRAIGRAAMRADPAGRTGIARAIQGAAAARPGLALLRRLTG